MSRSQSLPPPPRAHGRDRRQTSISAFSALPASHSLRSATRGDGIAEAPLSLAAAPQPAKRAWLTLLTRASYLPGVVLLGHSLRKVRSRYPLVVVVTPSLPESCIKLLLAEGFQVDAIAPIRPRGDGRASMVAERFEDTWSKLAVFGFEEYERAILLDSDMLILRPMDELFDISLPPGDIAANHACVCNLDQQPWAPLDWRQQNCAYTPLSHPLQSPILDPTIRTHGLLNSGLIVFTPSKELYEKMLEFLYTSPLIETFQFPDQDFLAEFFKGKWHPIGWQWNAIKTARNWHGNIWSDEEVRNCHYIVDKPWHTRREDEGEDEVTHGWWWREYEDWEKERGGEGRDVVDEVRRNMKALKVEG